MPIKPGQVWQEDRSILILWEPFADRSLLTSASVSMETCGRQLLLALRLRASAQLQTVSRSALSGWEQPCSAPAQGSHLLLYRQLQTNNWQMIKQGPSFPSNYAHSYLQLAQDLRGGRRKERNQEKAKEPRSQDSQILPVTDTEANLKPSCIKLPWLCETP